VRHGYENEEFRKFVEDYYDVEAAIKFLDAPPKDGYKRWRCVLCGYPIDVPPDLLGYVGATCCGGCGQTTLRPIEEYK